MVPVSRRPALALLALSTLPALAGVQVLVTAPEEFVASGKNLKLLATVTGTPNQAVAWSAKGGASISADGHVTAPVVETLSFITVCAASLADGKARGELTLLVLPGQDGTQGVGISMGAAPDLKGLPFTDFEPAGPTRYHPGATVVSGSITQPHGKQVVGYDQPVALTWDARHAAADGTLVTYREGGDVIRLEAHGKASLPVQLKGRIQDCHVESMTAVDGKARTYASRIERLGLQVRGLVPFAGSPYAQADDPQEDGKGASAIFRRPHSMTLLGDPAAGSQVCVVSDPETHVLRTVTPDGTVKTVWGHPKGGERGFIDGPPGTARFDQPGYLAAQPASADRFAFTRTFVVADTGNHAIRVVQEDGTVSTLAGTGKPGPAQVVDDPRQAQFRNPQGVAIDIQDNVFVADAGNFVIRRIDPQGRVTTLAGSGLKGSQDGLGAAAGFTDLKGLHLEGKTLYVIDGHALRTLDTRTGAVGTLIGNVDEPGFLNGGCMAGNGHPCLNGPSAITAYGDRLFITDTGNHTIRTLHFLSGGPFLHSTIAVIKLGTLAGDPTISALRWGRLRDDLPMILPPGGATLDAPRAIIPDGVGGLYASSGKVLAHLSESERPQTRRGHFDFYLDFPSFEHRPGELGKWTTRPLKAGVPTQLVLHGSSALDDRNSNKSYTWKLTTFDPATGRQLHEPLEGTGKDEEASARNLTFTQPLEKAGVLVTWLTEEGCTYHSLVWTKIEP